jgi:hypothetical protein
MGNRRKVDSDRVNAAMLVARPEYVHALDRLMLATRNISRIRLIDAALREYAERRGYSLPTRLASEMKYVHTLDE